MWQPGQSRHTVDRGIENQLRPLRGTRILQSFCLQPPGDDQIRRVFHQGVGSATRFIGSYPRGCVQLVLNMRVAVPGTAHESCAPNYKSLSVTCNDLFTTQSVLRRNDGTLIEAMADPSDGVLYLCGLGRNNAEFALGQFIRSRSRLELHLKVVRTRDAQSFPIESPAVF